MALDPDGAGPLHSYALVAYIPDPLGKFLDDLRRDLVEGCMPNAHVTVLPPRLLTTQPPAAIEYLRPLLARCAPFDVHMGDVEVFPVSDVIYIGVAKGGLELHGMHDALNGGVVEFKTIFPFHPHITIAQELALGTVDGLRARAQSQWAAFPHPRSFRVDRVWFVRNTGGCPWDDLEQFQLVGDPQAGR